MQPLAETVSPMVPSPFRVLSARDELPGCTTLRVTPVEAAGSCQFSPGQFYMVYVFGRGEVPISVSGDPDDPSELTFTVRDVGAVTSALCAVNPGDFIGLRGPFGSAWPVSQIKARDVVVIAGGLGLAPLRPAILHIQSNRSDYESATLLYGTRQPDSILYRELLETWRETAQIDVGVTVDTAGRDWSGKVGVVTELLKDQRIKPNKTSAMICGPEIMMRFSAYALMDLGVSPKDIFVSMERNMKCAIRKCGRCQYGPYFVCHDGPVFPFDRIEELFKIREV